MAAAVGAASSFFTSFVEPLVSGISTAGASATRVSTRFTGLARTEATAIPTFISYSWSILYAIVFVISFLFFILAGLFGAIFGLLGVFSDVGRSR